MQNEQKLKKEIERVSTLSEDGLKTELGKLLVHDDFHGSPNYIARVDEWLEEKSGKIYQALCREDRYPALKKKYEGNRLYDVFMISADAWLATMFVGLPVLTIARLVFMQGLDKFCGCE